MAATDGDGDGSGGGSGDGASGDINDPACQHNNDQEEQNHQPGAPAWLNGRDAGGGLPPDDDGSDCGDNHHDTDGSGGDPEGPYFARPLILPAGSGFTLNDVNYNNNLWMLRRAFWLCNIQDRNHAPLFVFGGLTTFEILSSYTIAKWTQFQKSAAKWQNCQLF